MDLTTTASVAAYMGIDATTTAPVISALVSSVSEAIEHYCGREFSRMERVEVLDGRGSGTLLLACRPIVSVGDVRFDPNHLFGDDCVIPITELVFYSNAGLLHWECGSFPAGRQNVQVRYTAGYTAVPASVAQAANMLVAHFYNRGHQGGDGVASESMGAYTVSYDEADWPASVKTLLNEFREVLV